MSGAATLMARLEVLARHSERPDRLDRPYLSAAHAAAVETLAGWMREAGLSVRLDPLGTLIGRYEGSEPGAPALLLGSHIDTVSDGGRYDGPLGVLGALDCVERLAAAGERRPFAIEVLAFGDEEGGRFARTLSGSLGLAGAFDPATLALRDAAGVGLAEALRAFGGDPARVAEAARDPASVLAYVELHIEQGPVLEAAGLPLGVVTAINGAERLALRVTGRAGHAGTVPMGLRRDALAAAAEMVLAAERLAAVEPELVATVGRLEVPAGAVNVIPGGVDFTLDLRAPCDEQRERVLAAIQAEWRAIAARRGVGLEARSLHQAPAVRCDPALVEALAAAVARQGLRVERLPSGAGHDAMAVARLCPVGMLFLRCTGGVSHHPDEAITEEDAGLAVATLLDFIRHFQEGPVP